ncbi:hypothetical protein ACXYMU_06505 [Pontibacter sp. CAU 1760]
MKRLGWIGALVLMLAGCKQANDLKHFSEATYSLQSVQDLELNGVDVMEKQSLYDFTTSEGDSLLASISDNTLQATTVLYLQVQLQETAEEPEMRITELEWQLLVDGEETLEGLVKQPLLLREGVNQLPVQTSVLMAEVEGMRNYQGLSKLMTLLSFKRDLQQRLTFRIKPTIETPVGAVALPKYITVTGPKSS